ncbi:bifunctional hydroxymethylpyrimidine kinase/phosphomethylpyrimidine kinase [Sunxiuqinia elliptica]|uniref:hydroxymethylpyrimidine kinase n=1 Tax=Sunxiuqinia elliptica TaxID=655355 RepID=A0A1I2IF63_9BACT|nr:bifunctional hydroxymethylpyrimidine kinase/phosphomethylpyrimidine kinase [Sunxiuqinia elliptica]SFF40979.1 hydroxymethylpyrimidine/phosphomethylpyrimidine kinase [Sunxiuqinia elliptica]
MNYKRVLSIAGSDPSGGAGIQADLKAISACGCFATTAITAIVDENTVGVYGVHPVPIDFVKGQIKSVLEDVGTDAIKIGMLHSSELIRAVKESILPHQVNNIVLDPVMVATSGDKLLQDEAIATLQQELIPMVRVITPNIPEAEILSGLKINQQADLKKVAKALSCQQTVSVLLKAGHLTDDELIDVFYNAETDEFLELSSKRINTRNTHGTGCTFSSALAAFLAKQESLNDAVRHAKQYINQAIEKGAAYQIGKGNGPVHHFHNFWS